MSPRSRCLTVIRRRGVESHHGVLHLDRDRTCLDRQGGADAEFGSLPIRVDVCVCLVHEPEARLGRADSRPGQTSARGPNRSREETAGAMLSWLYTEVAALLPIRRFRDAVVSA